MVSKTKCWIYLSRLIKKKYLNENIFYTYVSDYLNQVKQMGEYFQINGKLALLGIMIGRAGVAYQMMRIADPNIVPSILLMGPI